MVSTKKFVDLFRACYIISRNHSNMFLLINLQKTKICSKVKQSSKGLFVLISDFWQLDI